ncbi:hypothetical protein [uncultured Clostridium sp.]|uniref:crAss001_48 related protein n=1 Tax=uncultured Clostridium sp. TaxID=59620 RepID=UPI002731FB8D|nr:hypothetical protein [uncultured Clostridium sp.]
MNIIEVMDLPVGTKVITNNKKFTNKIFMVHEEEKRKVLRNYNCLGILTLNDEEMLKSEYFIVSNVPNKNFDMELKDTVKLMESKDYIDRFKAEYLQLKIRISKLRNHIENNLTEEDKMKEWVNQLFIMRRYADALEERAVKEKIDLNI